MNNQNLSFGQMKENIYFFLSIDWYYQKWYLAIHDKGVSSEERDAFFWFYGHFLLDFCRKNRKHMLFLKKSARDCPENPVLAIQK